jgi:hypothetical protein
VTIVLRRALLAKVIERIQRGAILLEQKVRLRDFGKSVSSEMNCVKLSRNVASNPSRRACSRISADIWSVSWRYLPWLAVRTGNGQQRRQRHVGERARFARERPRDGRFTSPVLNMPFM